MARKDVLNKKKIRGSSQKYPGRPKGCREIPGENGCKRTFVGSPENCRICESPDIAGMRRDREIQVQGW